MYEQSDFSPMDKSVFQKYEHTNLLFSDAFRSNYAYNSPSAALYANSPLGLGNNFGAAHSQQYTPSSSFAAVALNALNNMPASTTAGNVPQSTFGLHHHHQNQLNENTPVRSEHTSLEETQNHLEEQNSAEEEHQAALQAQHNVQSSSTIPNYPNYNCSNNNINSAINSNNVITTGSTNININGSNSMNFSAQQNFVLKKHLNDQHQQQQQQNQTSQLALPTIPSSTTPVAAAAAAAAATSFMGNNQSFRFQYPNLDENLIQTHSNYPTTPYYDPLGPSNDGQNSINYGYPQHANSPNYSYQAAPSQIQPTPTNQNSSAQQQNYSFTAASSTLKKNGLTTNFFYDSPRNYGTSFLPYTPPIAAQQGAQSGFSQFIQNQSFSTDLNGKQQQFFGEQEDCSSFPFLSTPVHSLEQQQNQGQQQQQQQQQQPSQQQPIIPQTAASIQNQKSSLNLLQQKQQYQQMQRYNQEKAQLQQQQMQYTEQALMEQTTHHHPSAYNHPHHHHQAPSYPTFGHPHQYSQQQQPSQFSNLMMPGQKILPLQPTPISLKNNNPHDTQTNKITMRAKKGKESTDEQNFQETQDSNDEEENAYENGEESMDQENQDGEEGDEDEEEDEDDDYKGSKRKNMNGGSKVKKGISKGSARRNKHATSISAVSSSSLQNQTNPTSSGKMSRKQINETKNIPKNYSKAIIGYIQKHPDDCARLLGADYSFDEFDKFLMDKKEKLTAIKDLRSLWTTNCDDPTSMTFNRVFRILSFKFFRENAVSYIYSSRKIKNTRALITYRFILQRALHDPESFSFMKFQN